MTSRRFSFTWNNPPYMLHESDMAEYNMTFLHYQEEIGGENGTHHFQGYIEVSKSVRKTHFLPLMHGAHIEPCRGTAEDNITYTSKDRTKVAGPYVWGTPSKQGGRVDLILLRNAIRNGISYRELYDDDQLVGSAIRYVRGVERMVETYSPAGPRGDVNTILHYGPPGTGKTHCANELSPEAYWYDGNNGFWNGYEKEKSIILDEFGGHVLTPLGFQRLCDKYPLKANVKGGWKAMQATTIHVCSNYLPDQWWKEGTRYNSVAISRRIQTVHYHHTFGQNIVFVNDDESDALTKLKAYLLHHGDVNRYQ